MVLLEGAPGIEQGSYTVAGSDYASRQQHTLAFLPCRIPATHVRWKYRQDATNPINASQNWNMAICDASGRFIASTGAKAFVNAANTGQQVAAPFTPALPAGYMFEIGWYYVWMGVSAINAVQTCYYFGWRTDDSRGPRGEVPPVAGLVFKNQTAGTTFDASNTILNMTDVYNDVCWR